MDDSLMSTGAEEFENSYMVFRVRNTLFAIRTLDVQAIQEMPDALTEIPASSAYVRGTFKSQGELYTLIDLNHLFQWTTSQQAFQEFSDMLDARKQDHVNWVNALRTSYQDHTEFRLARDHHRCALGIWRDNFHTESHSISSILKRLDAPHSRLHALADTVLAQNEDSEAALLEIESDLKPQVLAVLEEMKDEFKNQVFREMVLLLRGEHHYAITADQLLGVEPLQLLDSTHSVPTKTDVTLIRRIHQRQTDGELVLELDLPQITAHLDADIHH